MKWIPFYYIYMTAVNHIFIVPMLKRIRKLAVLHDELINANRYATFATFHYSPKMSRLDEILSPSVNVCTGRLAAFRPSFPS